jgi:hypothetical protein
MIPSIVAIGVVIVGIVVVPDSRLPAVFALFALATAAVIRAAGLDPAADLLATIAFLGLMLAVGRGIINLKRVADRDVSGWDGRADGE